MLKRIFDVAASATALFVLLPLLLPVAAVLRLTGEGEIFYRQDRVGRGGQKFYIVKFATMLKNSSNLPGGDITSGDDPRILRVGRFLRNLKINELPQLLNILLGDMSVIGPRPLTPRVAALFPASHWSRVAALRPGLSGIGSTVFRDEERLLSGVEDRMRTYAEVIVPYKMALEAWYADNAGLAVDIKLVALTVAILVAPRVDVHKWFPTLPAPPAALLALRKRQGF